MSEVDFIKKNDSFEDDTLSLVLDQFKQSTNYNSLVKIFSGIAEDYESLIVDAAESRLFGNAVGEQLDEIGRRLGIYRTTSDDDLYRSTLALNVLKINNTGTRDKIYEILTDFSAQDIQIDYGNNGVLHIALFMGCIDALAGVSAIEDLLPINTRYRIVKTEGGIFGFDSNDVGYGTTEDSTEGGNMSGLVVKND